MLHVQSRFVSFVAGIGLIALGLVSGTWIELGATSASSPAGRTLSNDETARIVAGDQVAGKSCSQIAECVATLPPCLSYSGASCGEASSQVAPDGNRNDCLTTAPGRTCITTGSRICKVRVPCEYDYNLFVCHPSSSDTYLDPVPAPEGCMSF